MHRVYLEETNQPLLNYLTLTGKLHAYLIHLDKQAGERYRFIVCQVTENEGMTVDLKRRS